VLPNSWGSLGRAGEVPRAAEFRAGGPGACTISEVSRSLNSYRVLDSVGEVPRAA
jgi:hypothetical protein